MIADMLADLQRFYVGLSWKVMINQRQVNTERLRVVCKDFDTLSFVVRVGHKVADVPYNIFEPPVWT